jgi:hypothetical protein
MIKSLKLHTDQTIFQSLTKVAVMSMKPFFSLFLDEKYCYIRLFHIVSFQKWHLQ